MKSTYSLLLGMLLALNGLGVAQAQSSTYPNKPVEMIVPWSAGGGTDVIARVYAEAARPNFSQTILVINKPGAIGSIGFADAAAARRFTSGQAVCPWSPFQGCSAA